MRNIFSGLLFILLSLMLFSLWTEALQEKGLKVVKAEENGSTGLHFTSAIQNYSPSLR